MEDHRLFVERMRSGASGGRTSSAALAEAASSDAPDALRDAVRSARARISMGAPVGPSFFRAIADSGIRDRQLREALAHAASGCEDAKSAMLRVCDEFAHADRVRIETGFGSMQKYMTLALLSSVILPSLALFGFIGYSMLYSSSSAFAAFSALLLTAFPVSYALLRRRMDGAYGP